MTPTRNHKDAGSLPDLTQGGSGSRRSELCWRPAGAAPTPPLAWEPPHAEGGALKRRKNKPSQTRILCPVKIYFTLVLERKKLFRPKKKKRRRRRKGRQEMRKREKGPESVGARSPQRRQEVCPGPRGAQRTERRPGR